MQLKQRRSIYKSFPCTAATQQLSNPVPALNIRINSTTKYCSSDNYTQNFHICNDQHQSSKNETKATKTCQNTKHNKCCVNSNRTRYKLLEHSLSLWVSST